MRGATVGAALALLVSAPVAIASLAFAARLAISPGVIAFALAVAVAAAAWTARERAREAPLIALLLFAAFVALSALAFDVTFDGQTYHQSAVRFLAGGWNPVWDAHLHEHDANGTYLTSLPKAAWIIEAMVYRATGALEAAKGVNLAAVCAAFLLLWPSLESLGVARGRAVLVAMLAAANPVALTQLASFYVDGLVASSVVIVVALAILWVRTGDSRWAPALGLMAAFLSNLKFPGVVYAVFIAIATAVWVWTRHRSMARAAIAVVGATAAGTVCIGVNPYVTNLAAYGSPVYPAAGRGAMTNVVHFDPAFAQQPRAIQLVRALASESSNVDDRPPRLKVPFAIHASEIQAFGTVDTRIGGLGPFFGGALLLAWGILAWAVVRNRPGAWILAALSGWLFCSALAIPFGYYSRYAPQLWLAALPALLVDGPRRAVTNALAVVLAVNTAFVGSVSLGTQLFVGIVQREQLRAIARDAAGGEITYAQAEAPFLNVDLHFAAYGIRSRAVRAPTCEAPARLLATHAMVCLPDGRSPAATPDPAREAAARLR